MTNFWHKSGTVEVYLVMMLVPGKHTVLVISDLQIPFQHPDALAFLKWLKRKYKPDEIVCIGDEVDMHALSDWDHDPDGMSAGDELKVSIEILKKLYRIFPKCKAVTSNHTARPFRRAFKHGIPKAFLKDYKEFLQAPSEWEWRDSWEIDGVRYFHGEGFSGATAHHKAALYSGKPCVHGHLHSHAGIHYLANEQELIFGFNVGCLIDRKAYAFAYGKTAPSKPIIGTGLVIKGVPIFIPMLLNSKGRWIKNNRG